MFGCLLMNDTVLWSNVEDVLYASFSFDLKSMPRPFKWALKIPD